MKPNSVGLNAAFEEPEVREFIAAYYKADFQLHQDAMNQKYELEM